MRLYDWIGRHLYLKDSLYKIDCAAVGSTVRERTVTIIELRDSNLTDGRKDDFLIVSVLCNGN